jgi:hypothetical protein
LQIAAADFAEQFFFQQRRCAARTAVVTVHSRVRIRCPGCQNVVEVVTNAYSVIHNADPEKYQWGEILEILPPDPKTAEESIRRNISLHYEIYQKRSDWRPG